MGILVSAENGNGDVNKQCNHRRPCQQAKNHRCAADCFCRGYKRAEEIGIKFLRWLRSCLRRSSPSAA